MKNKTPLYTILVLSLFLNSACVHVRTSEHKPLEMGDLTALSGPVTQIGPLEVQHTVFAEEKLPLENFLSRLKKGEFKQALKNLDINYKPSNTKQQILKELLRDGFAPVYVKVSNKGTEDKTISENDFFLTDGETSVRSLPNPEIPRAFQRYNPEALAANTLNVMTVVGVAFLFAIVIIEGNQHGTFGHYTGVGGPDLIINDTQLTTHVDYKKYLITSTVLKPRQEIQGLIFFRKTSGAAGYNGFKLGFIPKPNP